MLLAVVVVVVVVKGQVGQGVGLNVLEQVVLHRNFGRASEPSQKY